MPRSARYCKKRKNKGNRYYRSNPISECRPDSSSNSDVPSTSRSTPPSSSKKKLDGFQEKYSDISTKETSVNIIVDLDILSSVLADCLACNLCGGQITLTENVAKRNALVSSLLIECMNCKMCKEFATSDKCKGSELYETNVRFFYGLKSIGKGFSAGKVLCGLLNIATPPTNVGKYTSAVGQSVKIVAEITMKDAVAEAVTNNENNTDIAIGFDGTWQKRGFKSKNGCASATSIDTGKVLDVEILSKYCQGCVLSKKSGHHHECMKNYMRATVEKWKLQLQ